jgi:uncharacterized protein YkwD
MSGYRRTRIGSMAVVGLAVVTLLAARPAQAQQVVWALDVRDLVLFFINEQRVANGLRPLTRNCPLDQAAYRYANDMATNNRYDHIGSDGSTPEQRVYDTGYPRSYYCGEIIAWSYPTAQGAVTAWINSPRHRMIMLNPNCTECGIALVYRPGTQSGYYWCVDFGAAPPNPTPCWASPGRTNPQ